MAALSQAAKNGIAAAMASGASTANEVINGINLVNTPTPGTAIASNAVILDASANVTGINNLTVTGTVTGSFSGTGLTPVATVAATGTNQATGAPVTTGITIVTGADGTVAVTLPTPGVGAKCVIINTAGSTLNIYPAVGGTISYGSANAVQTLATHKQMEFYATSATQWYTILTA